MASMSFQCVGEVSKFIVPRKDMQEHVTFYDLVLIQIII